MSPIGVKSFRVNTLPHTPHPRLHTLNPTPYTLPPHPTPFPLPHSLFRRIFF
ncbi:MAG: hypothetical protein F6J93_31810 [Oscillatoria sp. SIO1A7]|nr:hypothetical protein [Oscillatoria sp. SIO1A7]